MHVFKSVASNFNARAQLVSQIYHCGHASSGRTDQTNCTGMFSLNFHGRPGLSYRATILRFIIQRVNVINVSWSDSWGDRPQTLSSKILATDVYPVHYLFIPTCRARPRFSLLVPSPPPPPSLPSRRWERISEARTVIMPRHHRKFSSRVFCHWETSCRRKVCINHEVRIRGIRPRRGGKRFPVVYYPP